METVETNILIDLPHIRSHVLSYGGPENAPAIFLIHGLGLTSNARVWNSVAPMLAQDFQVFAIDMRGHGNSSLPSDADFSFREITNDIHQVQNSLGLSSVVCVGHSWGADIALQYAVNFPEAVEWVVAIDGGVLGLNKVMTWDQGKVVFEPPHWKGMAIEAFREDVAAALLGADNKGQDAKYSHQQFDMTFDRAFDNIMGSFRRNDDGTIEPVMSYESQLLAAKQMFEQDSDGVYSRVMCPTLFISCNPPHPIDAVTSQFIAWRDKTLDAAVGAMRNGHRTIMEDAVHDVILQKPADVVALIQAFAGEVRSSEGS